MTNQVSNAGRRNLYFKAGQFDDIQVLADALRNEGIDDVDRPGKTGTASMSHVIALALVEALERRGLKSNMMKVK